MNNNSRSNCREITVKIEISGASLKGDLCVPDSARGIVLFAHGSGSSRLSPRNRYVAKILNSQNIGTLLFDLMTEAEERIDDQTVELRFNIKFLSRRLIEVTDWFTTNYAEKHLLIGYFGASTGAAAALVAASERPSIIKAIVSRGGRPDMAGPALARIDAPVLLIVGGADFEVIGMNQDALALLKGEKKLVIIPGATHLFEEPGAIEEVSHLAANWFKKYLKKKDILK
jgi:putative phosphoribosyl transferase